VKRQTDRAAENQPARPDAAKPLAPAVKRGVEDVQAEAKKGGGIGTGTLLVLGLFAMYTSKSDRSWGVGAAIIAGLVLLGGKKSVAGIGDSRHGGRHIPLNHMRNARAMTRGMAQKKARKHREDAMRHPELYDDPPDFGDSEPGSDPEGYGVPWWAAQGDY
jgi:hypothetical protein